MRNQLLLESSHNPGQLLAEKRCWRVSWVSFRHNRGPKKVKLGNLKKRLLVGNDGTHHFITHFPCLNSKFKWEGQLEHMVHLFLCHLSLPSLLHDYFYRNLDWKTGRRKRVCVCVCVQVYVCASVHMFLCFFMHLKMMGFLIIKTCC